MTRKLNIQNRTFAVALLPVILVCVALASVSYFQATRQAESSLAMKGNQTARVIAYMSEFSLISGNTEYLDAAIKSILNDPEIYSVSIYTSDGKLFIEKQSTEPKILDNSSFQYEADVIRQVVDVSTFDIDSSLDIDELPANDDTEGGKKLGTVVVTMSTETLEEVINQIIITILIAALIALCISLFLGKQLSMSIVRPITKMVAATNRLKKGEYRHTIENVGEDELGVLASGINNLAAKIDAKINELTHAREDADRANQAKSDFLAMMSHELRTPLTHIFGLLEILEDTELNAAQESYVKKAIHSSNALFVNIDDILDFGQIERGAVRISNEYFYFKQTLENVVDKYTSQAKDKNISLELKFEGNPSLIGAKILADETRLTQVLNNLIGNAIKFTMEGGVYINVDITRINQNHLKFSLRCRDTGIGIPEKKLGSIFELFEQADLSTTREFGGTGLGLTIAKKLIELMGGKIFVSSIVNHGSTFGIEIDFPYVSSDEETIDRGQTVAKPIQTIPADNDWRILLVEDQLDNREIIIKLMELVNVKVDSASDGIAGLDLFKRNKYDLVFVDCFMPKMDGFELTEKIREYEKEALAGAKYTPIIAITAAVQYDIKQRCYDVGMDYVITKPFRKYDLYRKLQASIIAKEAVPEKFKKD